jgi:hypothetical protein
MIYNTEIDPSETGIYACKVDHKFIPNLTSDEFLMWFEGRWGYVGSDQFYRGEVYGWIGPLPRMRIGK